MTRERAPLKPKKCRNPACRKTFVPAFSSTQVCCDMNCALALNEIHKARKAREVARQERVQVRKRKEAIKTIPQLKKEAQREFNKWVRARDKDQPCISCNAPPPDLSGLHAGRDAGHYRSTGSADHLRYHEDNCHAQCVKCNQWGAGRAVDYRLGLVARIGLQAVEALEAENGVRKWTREELIGIRDTYRAKRKELEREMERSE